MVPVLIALHRTIVRRQLAGTARAMAVVSVVLAALAAIGTLVVGVSAMSSRGWVDVVALTTLLWVGGRIAQAALGGEPVLRPELFALLPLRRRRLAWALLVIGLADPGNAFLVVALGAVVVRGVTFGPVAGLVAIVTVAATVAATSAGATLAAGLLGPGSARGRDLGTLVVAVTISLLAMTATMLPSLLAALRNQTMPALSVVLRTLPTGWASAAVGESVRGSGWAALALTLGLVIVTAAVCLAWPVVLGRRMSGASSAHRTDHAHRAGQANPHRMLAGGALGGVVAKELRLWVRDPIRLTFVVIALVVGTGTVIIPQLTAGTDLLMPYGGAMTAVIAAACACNLYGNDGTGLWLTVATPRAAAVDVRGRQLAWLIIVGPYAVVSTVVLTALTHQAANWPWALGLLAAVLGGGAGLVPLMSLITVLPLDAAGSPTPAWSLKIHVALIVVALTVAPPLLVLLLTHGSWWAVPVGIASGLVIMVGGAQLAARRLAACQARILERIAGAA